MIHSLSGEEDEEEQETNLILTQMLYYYPTAKEIIINNKDYPWESIRKIFNCNYDSYTQYEQEKLTKLSQTLDRCKKDNIILYNNYNDDDYLRFLYVNHFNRTKTINSIIKHSKWLKDNIPIQITDNIEYILKEGFIYIHGRDHRFRPMIFINGSIYSQYHHKFASKDWINSILFFLEYIFKNALLPGQVESINIVIDFNNMHINPCNQLKTFLLELQDNYPFRFIAIYCINVSDCDALILLLIKMITNDYIQSIIEIYKKGNEKDYKDALLKKVNPRQIEMKYGGQNEDMTNGYYPIWNFWLKNESVLLSWEDEEKILLSEDEYIKRKLIVINEKKSNKTKESTSTVSDVLSQSTMESNKEDNDNKDNMIQYQTPKKKYSCSIDVCNIINQALSTLNKKTDYVDQKKDLLEIKNLDNRKYSLKLTTYEDI